MKFTPTFESQAYVNNEDGGKIVAKNLINMEYFATADTAEYMKKRFGADDIQVEPYPGAGGPVGTDAPNQRILVWNDGLRINAGLLAAFFVRNDEDEFPNVAANGVKAAIQQAREEMILRQRGN